MAAYKDYILMDKLPHTWCAGCGHGIVLQAIADTFAKMGLEKREIALVSGIGCFGRVDDYLDINCVHVTHGRALPVATGIALANPELSVLVTMGDGDGTTIGGNHLIHAARRNVNLTAIIANNFNYGQTGGQYSGTTPKGSITSTSRYGHIEDGFDICRLVEVSGASYVARGTAYNPVQLRKLIQEGMQTRGFSLIEVIEHCPTHYGKNNRQGSAMEMMKIVNDKCVSIEKAKRMTEQELEGKLLTGCLVKREHEDYAARYAGIVAGLQNRGGI